MFTRFSARMSIRASFGRNLLKLISFKIMDTLANPDDFYGLVSEAHVEILERISPLIEEYTFCLLKIRQLTSKECPDQEQIALLQNIMRQDRKRIDDLLNLGIDPVYPGR